MSQRTCPDQARVVDLDFERASSSNEIFLFLVTRIFQPYDHKATQHDYTTQNHLGRDGLVKEEITDDRKRHSERETNRDNERCCLQHGQNIEVIAG